MKRILILLLYIIGTFHIANAQQIANLTKENAWQIVQEKIVGNKKDSVNVYVSNAIVKANSAIRVPWFIKIKSVDLQNCS